MVTIFGGYFRHLVIGLLGFMARRKTPHGDVEKLGAASWWHCSLLAVVNDFVASDFGLCKKLCTLSTARGRNHRQATMCTNIWFKSWTSRCFCVPRAHEIAAAQTRENKFAGNRNQSIHNAGFEMPLADCGRGCGKQLVELKHVVMALCDQGTTAYRRQRECATLSSREIVAGTAT